MTTPYATPHLDRFGSAYRHHLDTFAGTAMVGVLIVMTASLMSDFLVWPVYEALRSQQWYGPGRIVYRDGVGPVQVLDVDAREDLGPLLWVLVRRIDSPLATWAPLDELAPTPEGVTSQTGEVEQ